MISLVLHMLVMLVVFINLPFTLSSPEKEETVSVELVPPPEEQPPPEQTQEQPPEEAKAQEAPPEEAAAPAEEEPKAEEKAEAQPPEPPPAPEDPEEPPAPPPPPEEQTPPEPSPPPEPPTPEQAPEEHPAAEEPAAQAPSGEQGGDDAQRVPIPVLRPVFQFGDEGSGQRQALDGDSVEEGAQTPDQAKSEDEVAPARPAESDAETAQSEQPPPPTDQLPGVDILGVGSGADGIAIGALPEAEVAAVDSSDDPSATASGGPQPDLPVLNEAKKLFSRDATDDPVAVTAMANIPRGVRADQLCLTELREQLRNGTPPYWPELLPSHRLDRGTVFEMRDSAFRAKGQWYNLNFRCEIDEKATKVVSFAFSVGAAIPRSDWKRRGLPH